MSNFSFGVRTACSIAIFGSILASAVAAQDNVNRSVDTYEWAEMMPGVSSTSIWGTDPNGDHAFMVRISAGIEIPRHIHTNDYHGILAQGTWIHSNAVGEEFSLKPGSYVFQVGGVGHGDRCADGDDCLVLVHRHEMTDFIPE